MLFARRWGLVFVFAAAGCGDSGPGQVSGPGPGVTSVGGASTSTGGGGPVSAEAGTSTGGGPGAVSEAWMSGGEAPTTGAGLTTSGATEAGTTGAWTTGEPADACPRLRVDVPVGEVLNVRPSPSTAEAPIATLALGQLVDMVAEVKGEAIDGNDVWYEIAGPSGFVFSGFVYCTLDEHPPAPEGYYLPLPCGMKASVTQGNNSDFSHVGLDAWAYDFGLGLNTPMVAMADGTVHKIYDLTKPGDPCYNGGGPECGPHGNLVVILHGDNTSSYYKHLNEVHVSLGQQVTRGATIGLSGSTGYSTGRHAHVMRQENCPNNKCQSVPLEFIDAGVPAAGQTVTSMNCP